MKFEPVDFDIYNKPPYYPQYLSRGEAKKLVSFDDEQFVEVDQLIDAASDQYDLENAKGIQLDRIGKQLGEKREGNNDDLYRLLIRLRVLLNTTNGSVNDIIKVIKYIYSSEVVNIRPNYPAGLSILHNGESPSVDFNKYVSQVIPAGVSFETRELFNFSERIRISEDKIILNLNNNERDSFCNTFLRDGTQLRDNTVNRISGSVAIDELNISIRDPDIIEIIELDDQINYGKRYHFYRNGKRIRNNTITRIGDQLIPLG